MSLTVSTRKLPGLADQPQKTPATNLQEKNDLSSNEVGEAQNIINIAKERDMDLKQKHAHNVLQHIHFSIVTFLYMQTSRNSCQLSYNPCILRYGTSCSSNNANLSAPLESMTAPIHCFTRTTQLSFTITSVHFKSLRDICTTNSFC